MFKFFGFMFCCCLSLNLLSQDELQTNHNLSVESLIKDVFVKGNCRNVSNIKAIGNDSIGIGQFDNAQNIFNFKDGIIISTGDIKLATGPNTSGSAGFALDEINESEDADLDQLATSTLFDVTGIEFDFVPIDNRVSFRYVFASEEYCEFVGTDFNDVFGFFVSGPGIDGPFENNAINVATLEGSEENISINNVNHFDNTNQFINNATSTDVANCDIQFNPSFQNLIEYDGFTITLKATFLVVPCETYHIRLVIGDVEDAIYDSAVFLESKSFDLGEKVTVRAEVPGRQDSIAYEGCADGQFVFTRNGLSNLNEECVINYSISPESSATNGIDFLEIPMSVTIPAGESTVALPITLIEDNITEGQEKLKLAFEYECDCLDPSLSELIISETIGISANFNDIEVCANQEFQLIPEVIGGIMPYNYFWETGAETDTLKTTLTGPSSINVTVTDYCGTSATSVVEIGIQSTPAVNLSGDFDLCETIDIGIPVEFEGNPPWSIKYAIDGEEQDVIESIETNPFFLETNIEGNYKIIAFNDSFCEGEIFGSANVAYSTFDIEAEITPPTCLYQSDGRIELTSLDVISPYLVEWNIETDDIELLENLNTGNYILSIVDGNDCVYEKEFKLENASNNLEDCTPFYIPNVFTPDDLISNNTFTIFTNPNFSIRNINSFQVYDRWGELMFEKTNFIPENGAIGWNGEYNGKPLNPGVYVYKIIVRLEDRNLLMLTGDITLLR